MTNTCTIIVYLHEIMVVKHLDHVILDIYHWMCIRSIIIILLFGLSSSSGLATRSTAIGTFSCLFRLRTTLRTCCLGLFGTVLLLQGIKEAIYFFRSRLLPCLDQCLQAIFTLICHVQHEHVM